LIGVSVNFRLPNLFLAAGYCLFLLVSFLMARNWDNFAKGFWFALALLAGIAPTLVANAINAGSPLTTTYGAADAVAPALDSAVLRRYLGDLQFVLLLIAMVWTALLWRSRDPGGTRQVALVVDAGVSAADSVQPIGRVEPEQVGQRPPLEHVRVDLPFIAAQREISAFTGWHGKRAVELVVPDAGELQLAGRLLGGQLPIGAQVGRNQCGAHRDENQHQGGAAVHQSSGYAASAEASGRGDKEEDCGKPEDDDQSVECHGRCVRREPEPNLMGLTKHLARSRCLVADDLLFAAIVIICKYCVADNANLSAGCALGEAELFIHRTLS